MTQPYAGLIAELSKTPVVRISADDVDLDTIKAIRGMMVDRAEAAAALTQLSAENLRLREALQTIADMHKGDQPAAYGGNELIWADRHIAHLRRIAFSALSIPPCQDGQSKS